MNLPRPTSLATWLLAVVAALVPVIVQAQSAAGRKSPASKVYFSDVRGEAHIETGDKIEDVARRSVYLAQGAVIETKGAHNENDRSMHYSTVVYSNGTGAFFDTDTRVEVKRFVQEPFIPTRSDIDVEPSISQTQAFVSRGTVGLCASKLVAGSNMTYQTPHGSVNIRGRRVVIEATPEETKVSMLEGDSTIKGGTLDMGGYTLFAGQQAIIRPGSRGQPNSVEITRIPPQEMPQLDEKVAIACAAKKTVYFEVRERQVGEGASEPVLDVVADQAAGATTDGATNLVTAFDGNSASPAPPIPGVTIPTSREIVPVPIVPVELPVQFTVSPATLPGG